jgi:hypothetical protein
MRFLLNPRYAGASLRVLSSVVRRAPGCVVERERAPGCMAVPRLRLSVKYCFFSRPSRKVPQRPNLATRSHYIVFLPTSSTLIQPCRRLLRLPVLAHSHLAWL